MQLKNIEGRQLYLQRRWSSNRSEVAFLFVELFHNSCGVSIIDVVICKHGVLQLFQELLHFIQLNRNVAIYRPVPISRWVVICSRRICILGRPDPYHKYEVEKNFE